ncbi:glycerol dehydratase reactivase beta/small subunit family protein [Clostridium fallax]|uniref:Glycerol dehydratase reactivation factor, small subunit n=1 Tax=Clostridium fallax TaxID=1533 RepID=A0A1M4Y5A9_9CLOT|nr:glycerol dehydratase reactivase beta/small subunit family protein [Clostridium fallax]SHF00860.1 glycerol dehydratase reactivation factor, small subunit [Clostridium fallax]SQB07476.1 glycerol dehydratase reactivation factor, small subunit [Clostridium fallax]
MAMLMKYFEYEVPSIQLYYSSKLKDLDKLNEILWGIEEEGIPCEVFSKEELLSSEELSHMAACKSRLAVGIGIDDSEKITLTFNKLKEEEPLFIASLKDESNTLRDLGANAGRLVKGIAFK